MKTKYTPALVAEDKKLHFSIPLYQRLFEWQEPQIIQLLNDLKAASKKTPEQPYYIGMLTAYKKEDGKQDFDLVDGQQRFTVLMLMGIVFKWNDFLCLDGNIHSLIGNNLRLSFFARAKDGQYINYKIKGVDSGGYTNAKMEAGIKCIENFVDMLNDEKAKFINYVFEKLTFFISYLPDEYKLHDLNRYFEAMNATGRGLENHEILKVNLLKELIDKQEYYVRIWNAVSDMDKPLFRQRYYDKEKEDIIKFHERQNKALIYLDDNHELFRLCNDFEAKLETNTGIKTLKEIEPKNDIPYKQIRSIGERAILSFPEFLLQVLRLQINDEESEKTSDFFNVHKLQETFKWCLKSENVELFFKNLLKYRILFDYFIIRISNNDQNSSNYTLAFKEDVESNDSEKLNREKLIKFQSMLNVSTSSNIWLSKVLVFLADRASKVDTISFYNELIDFDNDRRKDIETLSLKYGDIDRYWFWRLDYYLWEEESQKTKDQNKAILEYSFRANRSIEHLHPQTSTIPWESINLNSFGNLAMISPSFNSTQSNDDENVKFARIENQINGKYLLESIKLLLMYQKAKEKNVNWNIDLAKEHGNEMIQILFDSFPDSEKYNDIREKLSNQK